MIINIKEIFANKTFKRFLIYFLIVLSIPIVLNIIFTCKIMNDEQKDVVSVSESTVINMKNRIDERISIANRICLEMAVNKKILNLQEKSSLSDRDSILEVFDFADDISSIINVNQSYISEIYVYFRNSNTIISDRSKYNVQEYYDKYFYDNRMGVDMFCETFLSDEDYMNEQFVYSRDGEQIVFKKALPLNINDEQAMTMIMVHMNAEYLHNILDEYGYPQGILLIARDNEMIFRVGDTTVNEDFIFNAEQSEFKSDSGEIWVVSTANSNVIPWNYYLALPRNAISKNENVYKSIIVSSLIIVILMGIIVSFLLAGRIYKPIKDIVSTIKDTNEDDSIHGSEYDYIKSSFQHIALEKNKLSDKLEEQKPLLKMNFFRDLLIGLIDNPTEVEINKEFLGINMPLSCFVVSVLKTGSDILISDKVFNGIYDIVHDENMFGYICNISSDCIAFILNGNFIAEDSQHKDGINRIYVYLKQQSEKYGCGDFSLGVSNIAYDMLDLNISFDEAKMAAEFKHSSDQDNILYFDDIQDDRIVPYYYPLEMEMQIINNVKIGNIDKAVEIFNEIIDRNLDKGGLSPEVMQFFFSDLVGTMMKITTEIGVDLSQLLGDNKNITERLLKCPTIEAMKNIVTNLMRAIYESIEEKKHTNLSLLDRVKEYIEESCMDASFSLTSVADYVGVSASHLSRYFKEKSGDSFINYVTKIRVAKAKEILKNENCSVLSVALRVGYTNESTLNRAFKKYEGITPGQYKLSVHS